MTTYLISGLAIVAGLIAAGIGMALAGNRLRFAHRALRRTGTLYDGMPEGWGSWFLGGFSGMAAGTQWLRATLTLAGWAVAGLCLIGLGVRLFWRA